jgi:deazaflavin-dependent oxidoreductase (nitroreductase family)
MPRRLSSKPLGGIYDDFCETYQVKASRLFWRLIQIGPRVFYALGLGPLIGRHVLLLNTIGRKTGRPRVTPLVYQQRSDVFIVASARGPSADWLRNVLANSKVRVRVGRHQFKAFAEVTIDPERIADYLQHQIERNPTMFGAILRSEGFSSTPSREELVRFAPKRPMVIIYPEKDAA